jgi:hypothetical protein
MRKLALFHVLDPGTKDADWNLVLFFARNGAGVTSDTAVLIDYEPITHVELITP